MPISLLPANPTAFDLSVLFFLQLSIILLACRLVGWGARLIGQPQVVGEMIAGVVLGPSLLGLFFPEITKELFPTASRPILFTVAQVGLAMYMFIVGMEFRSDHFIRRGRIAAQVSLAGMLTPFLLGALLAIWLYQVGGFFPGDVPLYVAVMFMGASMCITAFPMLARIIVENKLAGTTLGTLALAAGAIDDVAAWGLLAVVLSVKSGVWTTAVLAIGGGVLYAFIVLMFARPAMRVLTTVAEKSGGVTSGQVSLVLALVMLGSFITDVIGVYAVFGAFLMGCAMPRGIVTDSLTKQFEPLTVGLLLPLFFTYSGLHTRLDLVNTPWLIFVAIVVLIAASIGKGGACWAAARLGGEKQGTSIAIGALMNARGLMELILLNIAREKGVIGPEIFSILVLMAVITTLAATPVFKWVEKRYLDELAEESVVAA